MTRINAGIDPAELTGPHLLAEHREIKRIPNVIKKGKYTLEGIPKKFKLGAGHVKFFYDKLLYLHNRYNKIHLECLKRGYNVENYNAAFDNVPIELYNDWEETPESRKLLQARIAERLKAAAEKKSKKSF